MPCNYESCPAKDEIKRLIDGHKKISGKQDLIDKNHLEFLNLHTKLSGNVAVLCEKFDIQQKDREEKYHSTIKAIENQNKSLENHTTDEMNKFKEISDTFKRIEEMMIKDKVDNIKNNSETKLFNDKITWKVIGLASVIATGIGSAITWAWGKL